MAQKLSFDDVKNILENLKKSISRSECWSCDCFQGFITQLELDAGEDVTKLTNHFLVPISEMHGFLNCDTCPPGDAFSEYINETSQ